MITGCVVWCVRSINSLQLTLPYNHLAVHNAASDWPHLFYSCLGLYMLVVSPLIVAEF